MLIPSFQASGISFNATSTCVEASRIAAGPFAVPEWYETVTSHGTGMTMSSDVSGVNGNPKS